jgi:para-nitrobenzyl esterase
LIRFRVAGRLVVHAFLATAALLLGSSPLLAATTGAVRIRTGMVSGVPARDPAITVFRGIPFAAPPVGELRWRPPEPPIPWQGTRQADRFGSICPQSGDPGGMSEDCLFLNVWSGAVSAGAKRPVFVWIYGGGFSGGAGSSPQFDGEGLARKGLVVVTFNYRLGALGFLATPELSKESGHDASGNYGILDQIAALRWVHENIAAFGGDPGRVTIAGQSAGAGSVGFLADSPLAKGLFQRGIAESHARYPRDPELRYLSVSWRPLKTAENAGVKFAEAHEAHEAHSLQELRAMPWQKLIVSGNVYDEDVDTGSGAKPPLFRPVVDGWVIPLSYSETYAKGSQNDVPFVAGNNLDESGAVPETAFAHLRSQANIAKPGAGSPHPNVTLADFLSAAKRKFGPLSGEFLRLYPASTDQEAALANNAAVRDNSRVSTFLWATEWQRHARSPVFTYFWTHRPPGADHNTRGAYHGSEISYVFDNGDLANKSWTAADRRIAAIMASFWANIAANGNPNGKGLPAWPAFDPKSPVVMELGDRFGPIPVADGARLAFWQQFFLTQAAW